MHNRDHERKPLLTDAPAGSPADPGSDPVGAALQSWQRLENRLTPLVGDAGFGALYGRALRLTRLHFPWLTVTAAGQPAGRVFELLAEDLRAVDPLNAQQAQKVLLTTFTGLLSTLIGGVLTNQILNSASIGESDSKSTQEKSK